ncbi:hypothetical protein GO986_02890 [Deinococcus sp. HMF7620]|uniref:Uncharacterized protein n=1 Tax=Deinococcus arboris TaxID=2682977 RepID=A0A7C9M4E9_9DEIO|nr:hypothetical protein [Deinococcus arboris]MVN85705.1 hypothetical protein [Deinococcus arboris]
MEYVQAVLLQLAFQVPLLALWIFGIVMAAQRRRVYPALTWVVVGLTALCLLRLVSTGVNIGLPLWASGRGYSAVATGQLLAVTGIGQLVVELSAWVCLLVGLFGVMRPQPSGVRQSAVEK